MKLPANKTVDRQKAAMTRSAVHRKKLIAAMVLMLIMAVLWIRLLAGKSKPVAISASLVVEPSRISSPQSGGVEYIELPHISGRHNSIASDLFSAGNLNQFNKQEQYTTNTEQFSQTSTKEESPVELAAAALKLDAIVNDKEPQAYIENRLFEKGQSFRFTFRGQIYRFKVLNILADRVDLDCNGIIITKIIPQSF